MATMNYSANSLPQVPLMPAPQQLTSRLSYGKAQEEVMLLALSSCPELDVRYSYEIDTIYKLDAVVLVRERPLLPAVGVQFTTKHDEDKMRRTIDLIRRTRIVTRLLYLESECRLGLHAFDIIRTLVLFTATTKPGQDIVTAVLTKDDQGQFVCPYRDLHCFSMEAVPATVPLAA